MFDVGRSMLDVHGVQGKSKIQDSKFKIQDWRSKGRVKSKKSTSTKSGFALHSMLGVGRSTFVGFICLLDLPPTTDD